MESASPSLGSQHASRPASPTPYSIAHYVNYDNFSLSHRALLAAVDKRVDHRSFKEAMESSSWREAIQKKIDALEDN